MQTDCCPLSLAGAAQVCRCIGWGTTHQGRDLSALLLQIVLGRTAQLDLWKVSFCCLSKQPLFERSELILY